MPSAFGSRRATELPDLKVLARISLDIAILRIYKMYIHRRGVISSQEFGIENDPPVLEIGDSLPERNQRALATLALDFEQVASAIILDRNNSADPVPVTVGYRQTDQVGVIIFAFLEGRQRRAVDL